MKSYDVGDAAFQKKCIGKMGDVSKEGRTVLSLVINECNSQALRTMLWIDFDASKWKITWSMWSTLMRKL